MKTTEQGQKECNHFYGLAIMEDNSSIPIMKNTPIDKEKIVVVFGFIYCPWCGGQFEVQDIDPQIH